MDEVMQIVTITPTTGIQEMMAVDNLDEHMRDGILGCFQGCFVPDMPGVLYKGQAVDGETFQSWTRTRGHASTSGASCAPGTSSLPPCSARSLGARPIRRPQPSRPSSRA